MYFLGCFLIGFFFGAPNDSTLTPSCAATLRPHVMQVDGDVLPIPLIAMDSTAAHQQARSLPRRRVDSRITQIDLVAKATGSYSTPSWLDAIPTSYTTTTATLYSTRLQICGEPPSEPEEIGCAERGYAGRAWYVIPKSRWRAGRSFWPLSLQCADEASPRRSNYHRATCHRQKKP